MNHRTNPLLPVAVVLLLSLLACRPVFAIGWNEILIIGFLVALLIGPLLFRLGRIWSKYQESERNRRGK
jgi:hypothetical protein